jgi:hypothetical protein
METEKLNTYFAEFCLCIPNLTITVLLHNKSMSVLIFIQCDCGFSLLHVFVCCYTVSVLVSMRVI